MFVFHIEVKSPEGRKASQSEKDIVGGDDGKNEKDDDGGGDIDHSG